MIETEHQGQGNELNAGSKRYQKSCKTFWENAKQAPSDRRYNLTISEERKFVWFRVAKVGTRSTLRLFENAGVEFTAREAFKCCYPPAFYRDYFKFAFVRNSWDRFVSGWKDKVLRKKKIFGLDPGQLARMRQFEHFVDYCAALDLDRCNVHFRRQSSLIDLNHVDYVGRFEHFERDLQEVARILNLGDRDIPRLNASKNKKPYQEYYDDRTREMIGEMYRKDIQIFGYAFEPPIEGFSGNGR